MVPVQTLQGIYNLAARYKGAMTKQPLNEVDKQLDDLRNGWE